MVKVAENDFDDTVYSIYKSLIEVLRVYEIRMAQYILDSGDGIIVGLGRSYFLGNGLEIIVRVLVGIRSRPDFKGSSSGSFFRF